MRDAEVVGDGSCATAQRDPALVGWALAAPLIGEHTPSNGSLVIPAHCTGSTCPTWQANRMTFAGGQWLETDAVNLALSPEFTITLWLWLDEPVAPGVEASVFAKVLGAGFHDSFQLLVSSPTAVALGTSDGVAFAFTEPVSPLAVGRWTHLAATYSTTATWLFVDGVPRSNVTGSVAARFDLNPFVIGADIDGGTVVDTFRGSLADVRIYPEAMTESMVATLASCGTP